MSHSPLRRLWLAMWTATSDVEQAVCTLTLGPLRFRQYETRVARKSLSLPVCRTRKSPVESISVRLDSRLYIRYACMPHPANTPTAPGVDAGA
jgi:hypothetical protein